MDLRAYVHADEVSPSETQRPFCRCPDLCEALSGVWSDRGRKVQTVRSGLLAWRDAQTHARTSSRRHKHTHSCTSTHQHMHTMFFRQEGVGRQSEHHCPDPGFKCLEPFYLMNAKMTAPRMILYGWTLLVKAARCNSQFILLYHLRQLNILWADSSLGARFYHRVLIMLTPAGRGLHPFGGNDKIELRVGRMGCFMYPLRSFQSCTI